MRCAPIGRSPGLRCEFQNVRIKKGHVLECWRNFWRMRGGDKAPLPPRSEARQPALCPIHTMGLPNSQRCGPFALDERSRRTAPGEPFGTVAIRIGEWAGRFSPRREEQAEHCRIGADADWSRTGVGDGPATSAGTIGSRGENVALRFGRGDGRSLASGVPLYVLRSCGSGRGTTTPGTAADSAHVHRGKRYAPKLSSELLAGDLQPRTSAALDPAKPCFFSEDVVTRYRHHALAFCELDLEIHHVLLAERHFRAREVKLPHQRKTLVIKRHRFLAARQETLAPRFEGLGIM